ncbi:putative entry exclusion protein TrbK-alt [Phenylobacterium zucineum]|uniref:putative entry exclusion protein TrbK-alt n=1 Tax=Phenylobacterium zucineum TaxID=284016 RepID=UPI0011D17805|nr:putative entry exclusion protein TrbK-alt [Phenylobacterium zucineum]
MTRLILSAASTIAVLLAAGCDRTPPAPETKSMSGTQLSAETQRCARGGAQAANDPTCRAVRDENFDRFLGEDGKR